MFKDAWMKKAAIRYRGLLNRLRKLKEKPNFIGQDVWDAYHRDWGTSEFCRISEISSTNRRRGELATHTGGSASSMVIADRLVSCFYYRKFIFTTYLIET